MPKRAGALVLATATMISSMPRVLRRKILEFGPSHRTRWNAVMQELVARRVCHARLDPDDESNPNVCLELIPVSYIRSQAAQCETCESNCCDTCSKYKAYDKLGEQDWGEWLVCNYFKSVKIKNENRLLLAITMFWWYSMYHSVYFMGIWRVQR